MNEREKEGGRLMLLFKLSGGKSQVTTLFFNMSEQRFIWVRQAPKENKGKIVNLIVHNLGGSCFFEESQDCSKIVKFMLKIVNIA